MHNKIKKFILQIDHFFYKKFGSYKSTKLLENIKEAQTIFSYLNENETKLRFVGGCVRKVICGENINDIDIATSLEPDEVKRRLNKKDIILIDTGIAHGTVTAILNKKKFEITTLREDISTDGRHANVKYTLDWNQDALRRDFTINAIYADIEGRIFDPLNGISDLKNGIIKFIGSPEERIQEDYLRILRYFRFFLHYSKIDHNQQVIKLIKQYINGLNKVSNERIFNELKKILILSNIDDLFLNNSSRDIILSIFPQFKYYKRLKVLKNLEKKLRDDYDDEMILALLILDQSNEYEYFCHKFKTSNAIKNKFKNISNYYIELKSKKFFNEENIRRLIYFLGKAYVMDLLLFTLCEKSENKHMDIKKLIEYVKFYKIPKFPFSGEDLKKYGYETGKTLGEKLKLLEEKWIENNFEMSEKTLERFLGKIKKN